MEGIGAFIARSVFYRYNYDLGACMVNIHTLAPAPL